MQRESVRDLPDPSVRDTDRGRDAPFGARLKELRETAGLTQEELASRAGLTAKAVSALERGERKRPYPHTVRSLSEALDLPDAERASLMAAVPGRGGNVRAPTTEAPPTVLPTPATALVGRERDVEAVGQLVGRREVRLLTLTGTGGVGKTRLATEAARASLAAGAFPDGAVFVALAPLGDASLVLPTIAQTLLDKGESKGLSARESLQVHLGDKRLLLVLDNFEHVLGAAPEVMALVEGCPGLTVLSTSRAPLRVRGERQYPVPPLDLPDPTLVPRLEDVVGAPAVELFVERAREASPAFEPSEANAAAVAAICWRLDGLPLALELAAAKTRFLGPTALLSRLDRALAAGGARDLPERQRTMRSTIDWSYGLLDRPERDLFARLSVFAGGFTLEAAETVGAAREPGDEDVLMLLGELVEQSLVLAEPDDEVAEIRYRMLEPIRQYALEKLAEGGEDAEARRRHAGYYLALAERARPKLMGREEGEWLDRLESENDNLRAAVGWSLDHGEGEVALRLVAGLWYFWYKRGHLGEGRRWLEEALGKDASPTPARAEALNGAGALARNQADYERAQEWFEESLSLWRELGGKKGAAEVLVNLGTVAFDRGDFPRSVALERESLSLWRELDDKWGIALALNNMGVTMRAGGDLVEAASLYEESLDLFRAVEDRAGVALVLSNLGGVSEVEDEYEKAVAFYQESLDLYREVGEKRGIALLTGRLGGVARIQGDYARAAALYDESLRLHRELGDRRGISQDLEGVAAMLAARGQAETGVRLWAAVEALRERIGAPPNEMDRARYEPLVAPAREALGEEAFASLWAEGRKLTLEQALDVWREQSRARPNLPDRPQDGTGGNA